MLFACLISCYSLFNLNTEVSYFSELPGIEPEGVEVIDAYEGDLGYYVFAPSSRSGKPLVPVVFVHGYGALNPMIYGGWIKHLTERGHVVIYPRYQRGLFTTSPDDFVPNTAAAIKAAFEEAVQHGIKLDTDNLLMIGHSYGGVIISNLAVTWKDWELPMPTVAMLCEPGSGPLRGGILESYNGMDDELHLVVVVGDNDQTVGQKFGKAVFETAINTPARTLLWQFPCENDTLEISASHYEPYSLDIEFDNGIDNMTSRRALRLAKLDQVDKDGYWKVFDMLVARKNSRAEGAFTERELEVFSDLGVWPDNTPVCRMEFYAPDQVAGR